MKKYGEYLKNERLARNLSQEKLAKAIGITQAQISYYEKNINEPTIGICERIADYYEITVDELIGRDSIPQKNNTVVYNHSTHNGDNKF